MESAIARHLDDGELQAAATAAIRGYGPQIAGYLIAITRNETDGYDVFSQLCEDLWIGIGGFRRESSFRTWFYKLAWHAFLRFRRDAFRRRGRRLETAEVSRLVGEARSSTSPHLRTAAKTRLDEWRQRLKPLDQSLLILRVDRRLSWEEIAKILGKPGRPIELPTLWKRYRRLRDKLRKMASDEGLADE